jgi:hypothetical protein
LRAFNEKNVVVNQKERGSSHTFTLGTKYPAFERLYDALIGILIVDKPGNKDFVNLNHLGSKKAFPPSGGKAFLLSG